MGMIYSAAGPTKPFVELSHADVLLGDMYVSHHRELIHQDDRFVYQDVNALGYRDYISLGCSIASDKHAVLGLR
jgi:hypothetical protein